MVRNRFKQVMAVIMAVAMIGNIGLPVEEVHGETTVTPTRVNVHDPSIIRDGDTYYVFGSHMADASSTDLIQWNQIHRDYEDYDNNSIYGNVVENFAESFRWAGYKDGFSAPISIWAPDVIYNPNYDNGDGTYGAYMMYYSTTSSWRRSCIGYAVSQNVDGPYTYVDTIIYSGFTENNGFDTAGGASTIDTKWDNDYLNLKELVNLGATNGGIEGINSQWFSGGGWNSNYGPNAIDPTVFFGENGNMYMVYGSWSGGLFLLELNTVTGEAYYPGVDSTDLASGNVVDRYFGTRIAGGNGVSGEGPYIIYDADAGYYYLYETYGGLAADGGYNMRLYRAANPGGPYLDAAGRNAADNPSNLDAHGIKLIGNYRFYQQMGYRAAGHNSALIDNDGQRYLVYHQRFDQAVEGLDHQVRVHQQFINEDGWPVTSVYEYKGDSISVVSNEEVVGSYEFINHGTASSTDMLITQNVNLNEDGTISGDYTGTWAKADGENSSYVTMEIGGVTYKGVFYKQHNEMEESREVMTFTAIGNDNTCIWGSSLEVTDEVNANLAADLLKGQIPEYTHDNLTFPDTAGDATVTWSSNQEDILSASGIVNAPKQDTEVILTANVTYGEATVQRDFKVMVYAMPSLIYGFDFEENAKGDVLPAMLRSKKNGNAILKGTVSVVEDSKRGGKVLSIANAADARQANYLQLPSDVFTDVTKRGYTVSMWVNIGGSTSAHSALFEGNIGEQNQYPMTRIGTNLTSRINANGSFDDLSVEGSQRDVWQQVIYTVNASGARVYLNGEMIGENRKNLSNCFASSSSSSIQNVTNITVGSGIIWNDVDVQSGKFDDVQIYDGAVNAQEAKNIYDLGSIKSLISGEDALVSEIPDQVYTGQLITPDVAVTYESDTLIEGIDYKLIWSSNRYVGTAHVTIAFMGEYTGTIEKTFSIVEPKIDASQIHVGNISDQTYTGKALTPDVAVTYESQPLTQGTDYTLVWKNNVNAGKGQVTIAFTGDYTGNLVKEFTIKKAASALSGTTSYKKIYGGKSFTLNAKRTKGTGKVTYTSANKKVVTVSTTGKVTIKGTGKTTITVKVAESTNYKAATKKVTITVSPKKATLSKVTAKGKRKASVTWKKVTGCSGYVIEYATNKNFKSAKKVTVKSSKTVSKTLSGLKKGKTYYVRVRGYKNVTGTRLYGSYSKAKTVKVK